jgi:hypothetical protein
MLYSLTFESCEHYLKANLKADRIDPEIALAYMTEIHDACVASGHTNLLIIRQIPAALGLGTYFELARKSTPVLGGIKTAWVNPFPALSHDLEFFCLVSNNRGSDYKLFLDTTRAEKWLGKEVSTPTLPSFPRRRLPQHQAA